MTAREAATQILQEFKGLVLVLITPALLLVYDPETGLFTDNDWPLRLRADELIQEKATSHKIQETINFIQLKAPRRPASDFDRRGLIAFANGVLEPESSELMEHSPKHLLTTRIPHNYDAAAKCPQFDRFLSEVLEPQFHPLIDELMGCSLAGDNRHEEVFLLYGDGANGKSVLLKTLRALVGQENVACASLHDLADKRFTIAELQGKRLNVHTDIDSKSPRSLGLLKALSSGDPVQAERKYEKPFNFQNRAVLVFSCNHLPEFKDAGHSVRRRFVVIPFQRIFSRDEQDPKLAECLTQPEELQGLVQRALTGYKRYRSQDHQLSVPDQGRRIWTEHLNQLDPVAEFLAEHCQRSEGNRLAKEELWNQFGAWWVGRDKPFPTKIEFNKAVRAQFPGVGEGKMSASDRRGCWIGIGFKSVLEEVS